MLAEVIESLGAVTLTFSRKAAGTLSQGVFVDGAASTFEAIALVVASPPNARLQDAPGQREGEALQIATQTQLQHGDETEHAGETWEVTEVHYASQYWHTCFMATLTRKEPRV